MRVWNFGLYTSQHEAISYQNLGFGRSIIAEGSTSDQEQSTFPVDSDTHQWAVHPTSDTDFTYGAINVEKELLKAKLGQIPILVKVLFGTVIKSDLAGFGIEIFRFIVAPTQGDASNRYRDRTATIPWYEDAYAPIQGRDIESPAALTVTGLSMLNGDRTALDVTSIFERALRDNVDVDFMVRVTNAGGGYFSTQYSTVGKFPDFTFYYFYPIEFYQATGAGDIDLTAVVDDLPGNEYYLGAVERGQTGAPRKGFWRNYTDAIQQVEIFDDHPENEEPVQREGTGTGLLDYAVLADNAVSQLYTAIFYSSTEFEVMAVSYRDNPTNLHPQIDADASWRGDTSTDFSAPTGGFSIPAAAWQPGTLVDDEFEIGVRGNTTDTDWPADSNEQVEITFDDAGDADSTNWRPVTGRRVKSTGTVAIDATTKLIPTRYVLPADWIIGTKAFIQNLDDFDAGQIKSVQEADIGTPVHSGTGTDDLTASGNHNGPITDDYVVEIDAGGTPGTYKWSPDGGSSWTATGIVPTGSPQLLENGIYVTIPTGTNHDIGDYWTIPVAAHAVELEGLASGSTTYAPGAIVGTTLPFRDVAPTVFSQVDEDSGASESPASRVYLESTSGYTQGDQILLEQAGGSGSSELATIATGGVQADYLDLTTSLVNDYTSGDFVTKTATGQTPFWMRVVASSTTVEELKSLRMNARLL
jgi:hypothetical protein